jgi:hypothetical protein
MMTIGDKGGRDEDGRDDIGNYDLNWDSADMDDYHSYSYYCGSRVHGDDYKDHKAEDDHVEDEEDIEDYNEIGGCEIVEDDADGDGN